MKLNKAFWEAQYATGQLDWDIGHVSTPLKAYIDQLTDKDIKILIPGAGNGYEVNYLVANGFTNVHVIDIAEQPLKNIKRQLPDFPENQLIQTDFFHYGETHFDLILEQTFFCALAPALRKDYALKMHSLLADGGKLAGLLFNFPFTENGPPYGGEIGEYKKFFEQHFHIKLLEKAYNSIPPRNGNELFFIFEK